jgi:hypothetical protein
MLKRILIVLSVSCSVAFAADPPPASSSTTGDVPTEASIKQLLEVGQAQKLINTMMAQMDAFIKSTMQQATQGQQVTAKVQQDIDKRQAEMMAGMKEMLDWNKLEPMYVRVYQKSLTQQEVDGMTAFYKTPTGQALLTKMPVVMQNTINEMQQMMAPMIQRVKQVQQEIVAEIQAEKENKGG